MTAASEFKPLLTVLSAPLKTPATNKPEVICIFDYDGVLELYGYILRIVFLRFPASFLFLSFLFIVQLVDNILMMSGFEPRIFGATTAPHITDI